MAAARPWLRYLAVIVAGAGLACSDFTAPVSPPQKKVNVASPVRASFSRYILISGVEVCVEDCEMTGGDDDRHEQAESLPSVQDSLMIEAIPQSLAPEGN
jgi:hypothetical protein